jgi:hypothetical protein
MPALSRDSPARHGNHRTTACALGAPVHVVARHVGRQRRRGHRRAAAARQQLRRQPRAARCVLLDDVAQPEEAPDLVLVAQCARHRGVGASELDRALAQKRADMRQLQHSRRAVRGEAEDPQRGGRVGERVALWRDVAHFPFGSRARRQLSGTCQPRFDANRNAVSRASVDARVNQAMTQRNRCAASTSHSDVTSVAAPCGTRPRPAGRRSRRWRGRRASCASRRGRPPPGR